MLSPSLWLGYLVAIAPSLAAVSRTRLAERAGLRHLGSLRAIVGR